MHRTLSAGDAGPDVALFQRDLNAFYRRWGAPPRVMLTEDGEFGPLTALACRRVKLRVGLERGESATPHERIVIRHFSRWIRARNHGETYEIPVYARRTPEEIARSRESAEYIEKLKRRFRRERETQRHRTARLERIVRNRSSRGGVLPRVIVLHTTEMHNRAGAGDLESLAAWFDNPDAQSSSHIGNDAEGNDIRMVHDEEKAWTQAAFNSVALSIEQMGHAHQTAWPAAQLENTASWIAHWSRKYGIPIQRSTTRGVCQHRDLGAQGGGHHDCGPGYPIGDVLARARRLAER